MTAAELGNQPAFPRAATWLPGYPQPQNDAKPGLTLRQHYAGLALQGLLANPVTAQAAVPHTDLYETLAEASVQQADALLIALTASNPPAHAK